MLDNFSEITTKDQYNEAVEFLDKNFRVEYSPEESELEEYVDFLCELVEAYEVIHFPINGDDPIMNLVFSIQEPPNDKENYHSFQSGVMFGRAELAQEIRRLYGKSVEEK